MKTSEILKLIDEATTAVGNRVAALLAKIKSQGEMAPEDEAEGTAIVSHLTSIAADESDPVPAPPAA